VTTARGSAARAIACSQGFGGDGGDAVAAGDRRSCEAVGGIEGDLARLAGLSIAGGAVYDALVGLTAAHHGYRLLSCDRWAESVYTRLGVEVTYL
jgi:predicted nucleic acid-binding protein